MKTTNKLIDTILKKFKYIPVDYTVEKPVKRDYYREETVKDFLSQSLHQVQEATRREVIEEVEHEIEKLDYMKFTEQWGLWINQGSIEAVFDKLKASEKEKE